MHHMNALLDAQEKDCNGAHDSTDADPSQNLMLYVESMMKEFVASKEDVDKWEHWLAAIQMSAQEVLDVPKSFRDAVTGPEKEHWIRQSHRLDRTGIYHFWHKIEKKIVSGREGLCSIGGSFIRIGIQFRSE